MARIVIAPQIQDDIDRIFDFLFEHAPDSASDRVAAIIAAIDVLETSPRIGRSTDDGKRELVISTGARVMSRCINISLSWIPFLCWRFVDSAKLGIAGDNVASKFTIAGEAHGYCFFRHAIWATSLISRMAGNLKTNLIPPSYCAFRPERISQSAKLVGYGWSTSCQFRPERISQSAKLNVSCCRYHSEFRPERISQSAKLHLYEC